MPTPLILIARRRANIGEAISFFENVVRSYRGDDCLIWPFGRTDKGYATFGGGCIYESRLVQRVLLAKEVGPAPTPQHQAAHSCGCGHIGCVTLQHLTWATPTENQADRIAHGTHNRGERHGAHKLTENDVLSIKCFAGAETQKQTASRFGITQPTVYKIQSHKAWEWLG